VVHLHVFDAADAETFAAGPTSETLQAIRRECPGIPISLTTVEGTASDPATRFELIARWTDVPDLVTANMGEAGIIELCHLLLDRGVGIEAGLLEVKDAHAFVESGLAPHCTRVLVEPLGDDPDQAVAEAAAIEDIITSSGITLEQVHHGDGVASWAVNGRGLARGHGIRTGLEDTTVLPDGSMAADNAELVHRAVQMIDEHLARATGKP